MPRKHPDSHPANAPGDFYVENGMCIACEAPESEAPDLMAHSADYHCYFKRQPETPEEVERACKVLDVCCCGSVRYSGRDAKILRRLEKYVRDACDHAPEQRSWIRRILGFG